MYTKIKTDKEIEAIRESGKILSFSLEEIGRNIKEGLSGHDISDLARRLLKDMGGEPAFLNFHGYPDVICISINDQVVHGIPNKKPFNNGDIVSFDFGVKYKGMITDAARTVIVGDTNSEAKKLVKTTEQALLNGIKVIKDGVKVGDISYEIEKILKNKKLGVIRDLVGHGVGHELHEEPNIPNYGEKGVGPVLTKGMTVAIEPMATLGSETILLNPDGWTVITSDGSLSAHFEDTILITEHGYEVLTRT